MTFKIQPLSSAITIACAGATMAIAAPTAFAQQADATTLDRIEVTGSRIQRADIEGPAPVTVISREQINLSGQPTVADFLRNQTFNSVGSFAPSSGSTFQSQAQINLRGLGANYTLVLVDGRRMTSSPITGGSAQNLNLIPMAAVERIEVLKEGAAAVYGSDAIGGVVNIILRKDFEGLELSGGIEVPNSTSNARSDNASIVAGVSSDRGNVTVAVDHTSRGMMYNRDIAHLIPNALYPDSSGAYSPYHSTATFQGSGGLQNVENCEQFENSVSIGPGRCGFDHGATSANEASVRSDGLLVSANYDVTDNTSFFTRAIVSRNRSLGVYAAAPVSPTQTQSIPTISADNPNNPFGEDGSLYYRFTPLGTRDSIVRDDSLEVTFGLEGFNDLFGGANWELGVTHGRVDGTNTGYNYGLYGPLQTLIDSGEFNPFDPTDPGIAAAADAIGHTTLTTSEQRMVLVDGSIAFDLFDTAAGPVGFVTGFEYRDDRLDTIYDAQSAAGNVFGAAGNSMSGERASYAAYFESLIPLHSTLNLTVAARYDSYNDFGSEVSPRVGLEFRPIDSLLLRGSWGEGFRAPSLSNLYGATTTSNVTINSAAGVPGGDELACIPLTQVRQNIGDDSYNPYPVDPCEAGAGQYQFVSGGNPNLGPETSENWGLGAVFSPTPDFSVSLDYYNVQLDNVITTAPNALALRYGNEGIPPFGVTRGNTITAPDGTTLPGAPLQILNPSFNGASRQVEGLDLELSYAVELGNAGRLSSQLSWSHMLKNEYQSLPEEPAEDRAGLLYYPEDRGQLTVAWDIGDFGAAAIANHIGENRNDDGVGVGSWNTFDLQGYWNTPWNGRIAVGVRNVGDKSPPFLSNYGFPFYDNSLYNIYGRTPYVQVTQRF